MNREDLKLYLQKFSDDDDEAKSGGDMKEQIQALACKIRPNWLIRMSKDST